MGYWLRVLSKAKVILDLGVVAIANEFLETIIDIDGELKNRIIGYRGSFKFWKGPRVEIVILARKTLTHWVCEN